MSLRPKNQRPLSNDELAQAWELAAGYLDFSSEWTPDNVPEEVADRIKLHVLRVIQPFLYNKAAIIRRNAKLGKRR